MAWPGGKVQLAEPISGCEWKRIQGRGLDGKPRSGTRPVVQVLWRDIMPRTRSQQGTGGCPGAGRQETKEFHQKRQDAFAWGIYYAEIQASDGIGGGARGVVACYAMPVAPYDGKWACYGTMSWAAGWTSAAISLSLRQAGS